MGREVELMETISPVMLCDVCGEVAQSFRMQFSFSLLSDYLLALVAGFGLATDNATFIFAYCYPSGQLPDVRIQCVGNHYTV